VVCGGSWFDLPTNLRAAERNMYIGGENTNYGFRLARTLTP
jgi:formylglycine-generating enzyme required for sulfatase activity